MEGLAKKVEQILNQFFGECQGNRINQWAWGPFRSLILETIRNHNPIKSEVKEDVKK